ncbi:hypothetical protein APR12_003956 [Nocardia amikacinitolerans]|nr:hypothetical protein [Nocardia amikacinitolerans]
MCTTRFKNSQPESNSAHAERPPQPRTAPDQGRCFFVRCGFLEDSLWSPRGIPRFVHRFVHRLAEEWTGRRSQPAINIIPIDFCPQGLTSHVSVGGLWTPRGVRVESSRIPRAVHRSVHTCEQQGESGGTTRGRLEDERGTVFEPPQMPPVHPRVTRRPSPRHHTPGPAKTGSVHRFHSAYYYFSSSSYRSLFKTGCVESRSGSVRSGATRLPRQGEEGMGTRGYTDTRFGHASANRGSD